MIYFLLKENERGFSPLHFASSSRQGALCQELLLTHGAHINMQVCVCVHARNLTVTPALNGCCQTLVEAESLEAVMETDFSPLTHKMHGHMEDDKGGSGGLLEGTSCSGNAGNIHIISLELLWSDFFLLSCDLICEGVHTHKSDVILDQVSRSNKLP